MNNTYNLSELIEMINIGHEIEFYYKGKKFSITYYPDGSEYDISFTEFYEEPNDYYNLEDFLKNGEWDGVKFIKMWEEAYDIDIY